MAYHNELFPVEISYGSSGGPSYRTEVVNLTSGATERTQQYGGAGRYQYNVREGLKKHSQLKALRDFFHARQGNTHSFPYKDWLEYSTAADFVSTPSDTDQTLTVIADTAGLQYQLSRVYVSTLTPRTRTIVKPVVGTTVVSIDTVSQIYPTWAIPWSVDTSTGIITFDSNPSPGAEEVQAGCEYYIPCYFNYSGGSEALDLTQDIFDTGSVPDIPLVEALDVVNQPVPDAYYYGGATKLVITADTSIALDYGRVIEFGSTSTQAANIALPPTTNLPGGGPYFYLQNSHGTHTMTVNDSAGTLVKAMTPGMQIILVLMDDNGTKTWIAIV